MSYYYAAGVRGLGDVQSDCGACVNPLVSAIIADAVARGGMPDQTRLRAAYLGCGGHEIAGGGYSCATPANQAMADAAAAAVAAQLAAARTVAVPVPLPVVIAPSATLAVPGRSGNTFGSGDSYIVTVSGSANQPVTSTLNGGAAVVVGSTDAAGRWSVSGSWTRAQAGAYVSNYYVGGVFAGSFSFTVLDVSGAGDPPACGSGYSRVSGACVKDAPAADKPAGSSPAADLPAFLDFLPSGLKSSLSGSVGTVPVWLLAAGGAFYLFSNRGKR